MLMVVVNLDLQNVILTNPLQNILQKRKQKKKENDGRIA